MNIYFIYDKNIEEFTQKVEELQKHIDENKYKIKILSKITSKTNCDLYIVISDDLEEIHTYFQKIKIKEKAIIITSNIKSSHVLGCVEITDNVIYLNSSCDVIVKRIKKVYEKTKDT